MDSGDKQYVLVHEGGVFEPRMIQMGAKLEGNAVVLFRATKNTKPRKRRFLLGFVFHLVAHGGEAIFRAEH